MASFLDTMTSLAQSLGGSNMTASISDAAGKAAGAMVTQTAAPVTSAVTSAAGAVEQLAKSVTSGALEKKLEDAETLATQYLVGTAVLQAVAAGAALGIFILQYKTYYQNYGGVKANPRHKRRRSRR